MTTSYRLCLSTTYMKKGDGVSRQKPSQAFRSLLSYPMVRSFPGVRYHFRELSIISRYMLN